MALSDVFKGAVDTIMTAFDDLVLVIDYHVVTPGSYNPATNTVGGTDVTHTTRGIKYKEKERKNDYAKPLDDTVKVIIGFNDLPGVVPEQRDYMVIEGVRWDITFVGRIPGNPAYLFTVRAP